MSRKVIWVTGAVTGLGRSPSTIFANSAPLAGAAVDAAPDARANYYTDPEQEAWAIGSVATVDRGTRSLRLVVDTPCRQNDKCDELHQAASA